jgi:catechol 2,3-dioxygenase-like lactoylglutathione lyase family enzyme
MITGRAGLGAPVQIAYAVPDARAAALHWAKTFGAGPFFVREHIQLRDIVYRGRPAEFDHTSAYGQWGNVMVELVQDHGTGPSVVRERYAVGESGLHHVAFFVDDLDASTAQLGRPVAMQARSTGTTFRFVDTVAELGHMIELYEHSDRLDAFYGSVAEAATGWDGRDPIRSVWSNTSMW